MTVVSSSSDSDSEMSKSESDSSESSESSDSSDSDGLENWMILGGGGQDGDQSISLNLEDGCHINAGVSIYCRLHTLVLRKHSREHHSVCLVRCLS